ncbi:competence/damage-inducible protein A [Jeotgalibaca sp. A122]|uniref:competence/damage-inducible protein A n=1 Tax=Jeotgalibaca sp. A122 TaxID=3457322 RepID=UPI003FD5530C
MIAEIISVGTELLLGQIVNTDAAYLAKNLADLGINAYFQTVVGDNVNRLKEAITIAEGRSELLIFTGGLGPTQDDVTKETVAYHLQENLILDDTALANIKSYFELSGRKMTENNRKQALYFENGIGFPNRNGHALGTFIEKGKHLYLLVPGPPKELTLMFDNEILPFLEKYLGGSRQSLVSKTLRFYGIGESELVTKLDYHIKSQTNPTVAPYAGDYEVTLRLTASGTDENSCVALLSEKTKEILEIVGDYYYGEGHNNSLVKTVGNLLKEQHKTISAAESLTGGLFQSTLVSIPNSSDYFMGGMVTYHESVKREVLGVPAAIVQEHGVVSEACAMAMADRCREIFQTDIAISFTGVAGPEALEGEPAGTVWIGLSQKGKNTKALKYRFMHNRTGNRERSVMQGLDLIRRSLLE